MYNVRYIILIKKHFLLKLLELLAENGFEPLTFGL